MGAYDSHFAKIILPNSEKNLQIQIEKWNVLFLDPFVFGSVVGYAGQHVTKVGETAFRAYVEISRDGRISVLLKGVFSY